MGPCRAERALLSIVCGFAIATASLPVAAAVTHDAAPVEAAQVASPPSDEGPPPVETPAEDAPIESPDDAPPPVDAPSPEPPKPEPAPPAKADAKNVDAPKAAPADDGEIPERLSPLQTAGWWTLFGGVTLGTLAGVMAGLAERQEDRALRMSVRFELESGAQTQYEDVQGEYESTLRKGRAQAAAGVALAVIGLAASVAGIAMLGVAGARQRKAARAKPSARVDLRSGGLRVRF